MSLIVALYAIKLAARQTTSPKYSYGWQRAEILGAWINGVFLLALCLSIFMEAIQRFFEPQGMTFRNVNSDFRNLAASAYPCRWKCGISFEYCWTFLIPRARTWWTFS